MVLQNKAGPANLGHACRGRKFGGGKFLGWILAAVAGGNPAAYTQSAQSNSACLSTVLTASSWRSGG